MICLWLILTRLNRAKPNFHSVFAAPEYLCDIKKGGNLQIKIRVIHVIRVTFSEPNAKIWFMETVILLYCNAWMIFCFFQTVNCNALDCNSNHTIHFHIIGIPLSVPCTSNHCPPILGLSAELVITYL